MRGEPSQLHRKGADHETCGAKVLPPPLPSERESPVTRDLGTEYMDAAKAILTEPPLRLRGYMAKKQDNTGVGVEDLVSIDTTRCIKSTNTFYPKTKNKLSNYASRCIENEVLIYVSHIDNRTRKSRQRRRWV